MSASLIHFTDKNVLKKQIFTASGSFVVPKGVTSVIIEGCGGGGGGGRGLTGIDASNQSSGGGGGGTGCYLHQVISQATELSTLTITIGAGGASETDGASTTITGLGGVGDITFPGGTKGANGTLAGIATNPGLNGGLGGSTYSSTMRGAFDPFAGGQGGDTASSTSQSGDAAASYVSVLGGTITGASGGSGGSQAGGGYGGGGGGGGGSSSFGPGGSGGNGCDNTSNNATAGQAAANYGAGGGGGGGGAESSNRPGGAGGTGGNGIVIIYYADAG